jgi:hypothetical protein
MTTHHRHHGGIVRRSPEPRGQPTNRLDGGSQSVGATLSQSPTPNMPGAQVAAGGPMPVGPGSPAPAEPVLPPGMMPR